MHLKTLSLSFIAIVNILISPCSIAKLDDSLQLKLERAGRLIASTYVLGNPDEKLFGLMPDYTPARPREMIHNNIIINISTEHSMIETKEEDISIQGFIQFSKWLDDAMDNYTSRKNLQVRTMGVCIDGCCHYPLDGGISHNVLYLKKACFAFKDEKPYLKSIKLYDGD